MQNKLIIITINYNQVLMTINCIRSIINSEYENYEIVLIDNGSRLEDYEHLSYEFIQHDKVKLFRIDENCGYVSGVNFGLKMAIVLQADYILVMNNDTIIDKNALTQLMYCCQRYSNKAIVSGKVYYYDFPNKIQYIGSYYTDKNNFIEKMPGRNENDDGRFDLEVERDMLDDIFWLFHINLIIDVGYYSTDFFLYAEQADFALRAKKKGYKLIYSPTAKLWHKGSITTGGGDRYSPPVNYRRKKSIVIFLYKHQKGLYFIKKLLYLFIKLSYNYYKSTPQNKSSSKAAFIGYLHGIKWIFNRESDTGYNPFL